jgi:hypothetical protein
MMEIVVKCPHPPFGHLLPFQEEREKANLSAFSRAVSHGRRCRQADEGSLQ